MRKKSLVVGLVSLGLTIMLYVLPRALRTSIIIGSGVMMANFLGWLFYIPLIIAILALSIFSFLVVEQILQQIAEKKQKVTLSYKSKTLRSDDVRDLLNKHQEKHPSLTSLLNDCLHQIDSIKRRQASLAEMIELNDAEFLSDAPSALDESKQLILRNLMWVVNRGIAVATDDADTSDDEMFKELIEKVLAANKDVLTECQKMLNWASDLISQKGTAAGSTIEVKAWAAAIRQQIKSSSFVEEDDKV